MTHQERNLTAMIIGAPNARCRQGAIALSDESGVKYCCRDQLAVSLSLRKLPNECRFFPALPGEAGKSGGSSIIGFHLLYIAIHLFQTCLD